MADTENAKQPGARLPPSRTPQKRRAKAVSAPAAAPITEPAITAEPEPEAAIVASPPPRRRDGPRPAPRSWWKLWPPLPVPDPQAPFTLSDEATNYGNRIQLFTAIAEQIWREQQLVSTRMQWNFTFQAFLAGIYVFAGSNLDDLPRFLVQSVLGLVGLVVTVLSLFGVRAAQRQSTRLKEHWLLEFHPDPPHEAGDCNICGGAFPQPFSSTNGSIWGRSSSIGVCYAMMAMWVAMLGITVWMKAYPPATAGLGYSCQLKAATDNSGDLAISCKAQAASPPSTEASSAAASTPLPARPDATPIGTSPATKTP
jgi:hypothetical protein